MHDPMVVAFDIPRPWPQRARYNDGVTSTRPRWQMRYKHKAGWWDFRPRYVMKFWQVAGRGIYWPDLVTVWHVEPDGHDSGEVCKHYSRWQDGAGEWHHRTKRAWRWHVHHWKITIRPLQHLRRWALTRCEWCGGRSTKRDPVNVSHSWHRKSDRMWTPERGLFHRDCSSVESAHRRSERQVDRRNPYYQRADAIIAERVPAGARMDPKTRTIVEALWNDGRQHEEERRAS